MYELLHAGFDTIDVAMQGALPKRELEKLKEARETASARQEPVLTKIGPRQTSMHVFGHGMRGGYAVIADTGPMGAQWRFKDNIDPREWNVFVSPHATMLLANRYPEAWEHIKSEFAAMGGLLTDHSLNRVDFAMDFKTTNFELRPEQIVAPSHTKVQPFWSEERSKTPRYQPTAIYRGRQVESVTIGKQPGRQVIVYDKRKEAIERQKSFWFSEWDINPSDKNLQVWRVEVRAGKRELKEKYQIKTFSDFEEAIGDVIANTLSDIRYVDSGSVDSNISRNHIHPLWIEAQNAVRENLFAYRAGLTPGQVLEVERQVVKDRYRVLLVGNAVGLAIAKGIDPDDVLESLADLGREEIEQAVREAPEKACSAVWRAKNKLHFIS